MTDTLTMQSVENPSDELVKNLNEIISILINQIEMVKNNEFTEFDQLCRQATQLADTAAAIDAPGDEEIKSLLLSIRQLRSQLGLTLAAQYHEAGLNLRKMGEGKAFLRAYK